MRGAPFGAFLVFRTLFGLDEYHLQTIKYKLMPNSESHDDFSHVPNVAYVSPLELKPNRVLIGLGVGIIIIVIGILGYLLVDKLFLGESATAVPNIEITKKVTITKVATTSSQKDETADLKTYSNNVIGIEFKYPKGWVLTWENTDGKEFQVKNLNISNKSTTDVANKVNISMKRDPSTVTKGRYEEVDLLEIGETTTRNPNIEYPYTEKTTRISNIEIDGQKALRIETNLIPEPNSGISAGYSLHIYFVWSGEYWDISLNTDNKEVFDASVKILDEILSTFKFLD